MIVRELWLIKTRSVSYYKTNNVFMKQWLQMYIKIRKTYTKTKGISMTYYKPR